MANVNTTYSNIRKGVFKNVLTTLSGNVTDVGTRVYGSYPLTNIQLPLIVVEGAQKSNQPETNTVSQDNSRVAVINVTVFAKQMEKLDTYMDEVEALIEADRATYKTNGMIMPNNDPVEDVDEGTFFDLNEQRSHTRTIAITFEVER